MVFLGLLSDVISEPSPAYFSKASQTRAITTAKMEEDLTLLCTYLRLARQNQLLQTEGVH
jgi:hypothetical protein